MSWTEQYCYNCIHWNWDGKTPYSGDCAAYSCSCATAILQKDRQPPPRFTDMKEFKELEKYSGKPIR